MAEKTSLSSYKDLLDSVSSFNSKLLQERRGRIPYFDSNSGIAFHDGRRSYVAKERGKGTEASQIITYPSRRWKLRPRPPQPEPVYRMPESALTNINSDQSQQQQQSNNNGIINGYPPAAVPSSSSAYPLISSYGAGIPENNNPSTSSGVRHFGETLAKDGPAGIWPTVQAMLPPVETAVLLDEFEEKDFELEDEDYEDSSSKKKKKDPKQPSKAGKARKDIDYTVVAGSEKPYSCNYCHMTYKTRPGLTYHVTKEHPNGKASVPKIAPPVQNSASADSRVYHHAGGLQPQYSKDGRLMICDFCEGPQHTTKPAPRGEKLITCAGCGHSAHPTCLSFSKNQRDATRHYPWKCMECKSCALCNMTGSDEKLLFCDDCDRGYHMYCVNPPLDNTPEGPWSCDPCLIQYGEEAAHRVWKRKMQQEAVARYQMEMQDASRRAYMTSSNMPPQQHYSSSMPMQMDMARSSSTM